MVSFKEQNEEGRPRVAGLSPGLSHCNANVRRRCRWWSIENSGDDRKVPMVAADQRSGPPRRRAYGARKARARNPPVDPNHRGRCLRLGFQVHAHRGPGRTAKANRDTHRPVDRPVETAKRRLEPGHRGTERPTCASKGTCAKRSSPRGHCHQPGQLCSRASKRSSKRKRSLNRRVACAGHDPSHIFSGGAAVWRSPDRSEAMVCGTSVVSLLALNTSVA
jgi:hypothetical protein